MNKKDLAKKIIEDSKELTLRPKNGDRSRLFSFLLREVALELQYYDFKENTVDFVFDIRDLYDLADAFDSISESSLYENE